MSTVSQIDSRAPANNQLNANNAPFKIVLIDIISNECALCKSKQIQGDDQKFHPICKGCSLPNDDIPIK